VESVHATRAAARRIKSLFIYVVESVMEQTPPLRKSFHPVWRAQPGSVDERLPVDDAALDTVTVMLA
jgi:hypothetical protein